jgi:hypothetical protein
MIASTARTCQLLPNEYCRIKQHSDDDKKQHRECVLERLEVFGNRTSTAGVREAASGSIPQLPLTLRVSPTQSPP